MPLRPILIHPDPRLRKECEQVTDVDDALRELIDDMFATMYAAPGIGLAAPQVGVTQRLFVMDCAARDEEPDAPPEPLTMINPVITAASDETSVYQEGCLSIPDQFEDVTRPAEITVSFMDRDGAAREMSFDGVRATCVQHEIDHLNGKLFIDYLGPVRRSLITQKMKKLKRERAKERAKDRAKA